MIPTHSNSPSPCPTHHSQLLPGLPVRASPVAHVQVLDGGVGPLDLDVPVEDDRPRVELLSVVHNDCVCLLDDCEHHDGAQGAPGRQRHVGERLWSRSKICYSQQWLLLLDKGNFNHKQLVFFITPLLALYLSNGVQDDCVCLLDDGEHHGGAPESFWQEVEHATYTCCHCYSG